MCHTRFTILPVFAAPGKWYGYSEIEQGIAFVAEWTDGSLNKARLEWDFQRDLRVESKKAHGPCGSSILRWWAELDQEPATQAWFEHAKMEISHQILHSPVSASEAPPVVFPADFFSEEPLKPITVSSTQKTIQHRPAGAKMLFGMLRTLGHLLLQMISAVYPPQHHAISGFLGNYIPSHGDSLPMVCSGIWFLEGGFKYRCLTMVSLGGRVIPGQSPSLTVTSDWLLKYFPEARPPP